MDHKGLWCAVALLRLLVPFPSTLYYYFLTLLPRRQLLWTQSLAHFLLGFVHLNSRYYSLSSPSVAFHPLQTCENVLPLKFDLPKLEQEGVCRTKPTHHHVFCIPFQASLFRVVEISENKGLGSLYAFPIRPYTLSSDICMFAWHRKATITHKGSSMMNYEENCRGNYVP